MNEEMQKLFRIINELKKLLNDSAEKAGEASELAEDLSGEFDQEISTDMDEIQEKLNNLLDDLNSLYEESRTLSDDEDQMEQSFRAGLDDEENYKVDSERIQEEIEEEEEKE
jgi:methyl-accepting chemotaxis protein